MDSYLFLVKTNHIHPHTNVEIKFSKSFANSNNKNKMDIANWHLILGFGRASHET